MHTRVKAFSPCAGASSLLDGRGWKRATCSIRSPLRTSGPHSGETDTLNDEAAVAFIRGEASRDQASVLPDNSADDSDRSGQSARAIEIHVDRRRARASGRVHGRTVP